MEDGREAVAFERARDIPYHLALFEDEPNHSCVGKHQQLKDELEKMGYGVRWVEAAFRWSELPLPQVILALPHDDDTTHAYLEVQVNDEWLTIDCTWDKGLAAVLPVNEWGNLGNMKIAVPVLRRIPEAEMWINRETSDQDTADELHRNREFFSAINEWLDQNRKENPNYANA